MNNKMKMLAKGIAIMCVMALSFGLLAGCGQSSGGFKDTTKEGSTEEQKGSVDKTEKPAEKNDVEAKEPVKMSIMNIFYDPEPPKDDSPVMKKIEEFTNFDLEMIWVPSSAYNDKINVTIASNELPSVIMVRGNKNPNIISAVRAGMFWEVGPYIKEFPNLSTQLNDVVFNNISVDGKIYGIYRSRNLSRSGYVYRRDWLENLGMQEPETIDDFYAMMKAFTVDDPDKNGKKDTFGLAEDFPNFDFFIVAYGGPNRWGLKDGKLLPEFMFPENMEAMKFYKRLYDEGLMNQDFAIIKGSQKSDFINQGKAGAYIGVADDCVHSRHNDLFKLFPDAVFAPGKSLNGPKGRRIPAGSGYNGVFMFPKPSVKTEEDLKKYMTFFDKMGEPEMQNLLKWGIEGEHYEMVDGVPEIKTDEQQKRFAAEVNPFRQLGLYSDQKAMKGRMTPMQEEVHKYYEDNLPNIVPNLVLPYISNTEAEKGSELNKIIDDARVKFILGEIDEEGFKQAVKKWQENGGDKIIEEYNNEYQRAQKNK